jgi:uncharacterized protein (UPF0332 family)
MSGNVDDLINYRVARARETLEEAQVLADTAHWNASVNRLYYACFYSVSALLLRNALHASKHTGIRSFFNLHFVKTGSVSKEIARIYNDLFERRQESDYADFVNFTREDVHAWISEALLFVDTITEILNEHPEK